MIPYKVSMLCARVQLDRQYNREVTAIGIQSLRSCPICEVTPRDLIEDWDDAEDFLTKLAAKTGKLLKVCHFMYMNFPGVGYDHRSPWEACFDHYSSPSQICTA